MRYWTFAEPGSDFRPVYHTLSDAEIIKSYRKQWHERMCKKYNEVYVDAIYNNSDCIDDWVASNWAWESDDEGNQT